MRVVYVVNNYALGCKVKTTPVDKIVKQERVSQKHTLIVYELSGQKEKEFCDKVLAKNGQVVD
jgi:hypothetical protein